MDDQGNVISIANSMGEAERRAKINQKRNNINDGYDDDMSF